MTLPPCLGSAQLKRDVSHGEIFALSQLGLSDEISTRFVYVIRNYSPACEIDKISGILNQITRERDFNCSNRPDCFISSCNRRAWYIFVYPLRPLPESRIHYFLISLPRLALFIANVKRRKVRGKRNFGQVEFQSLVSARDGISPNLFDQFNSGGDERAIVVALPRRTSPSSRYSIRFNENQRLPVSTRHRVPEASGSSEALSPRFIAISCCDYESFGLVMGADALFVHPLISRMAGSAGETRHGRNERGRLARGLRDHRDRRGIARPFFAPFPRERVVTPRGR